MNPLEILKRQLSELESVAIAYSGGVDSTFLLKVAVDTLGRDHVLALIADTPTLPRRELEEALVEAKRIGAECRIVKTDELADETYLTNPPDRCYLCKKRIFSRLLEVAHHCGFEKLADGDNADDAHEERPGRRAVMELGILSPLQDGGWTKQMIRDTSEKLGLSTAWKPALACLATRIPTGERITREKLARVERAENAMHQLGFPACRVRCHGNLARIELQPSEFTFLKDREVREKIDQAIRAAGFEFVSVDLLGYGQHSLKKTTD